jgi:hypothetical protein
LAQPATVGLAAVVEVATVVPVALAVVVAADPLLLSSPHAAATNEPMASAATAIIHGLRRVLFT